MLGYLFRVVGVEMEVSKESVLVRLENSLPHKSKRVKFERC